MHKVFERERERERERAKNTKTKQQKNIIPRDPGREREISNEKKDTFLALKRALERSFTCE